MVGCETAEADGTDAVPAWTGVAGDDTATAPLRSQGFGGETIVVLWKGARRCSSVGITGDAVAGKWRCRILSPDHRARSDRLQFGQGPGWALKLSEILKQMPYMRREEIVLVEFEV